MEIDGASHIGSEAHIRKDRLLMRAGVPVLHILNAELLKHGQKVVSKLLPRTITEFWDAEEAKSAFNPLYAPF